MGRRSQNAILPCWARGFSLGGALLLAFAQSPAFAQIVNPEPILNQVENVTREVERVTDSVRREVTDTARDAADAAQDLTRDAGDALDPLTELPKALPVLSLNGETVFVDVEVEDGWRAVDRQWLVMLGPDELTTLLQLDIEILEQSNFQDLGLSLLRFRVPDELNSRDALRQVLPSSLVDRFDRNHIYNPQNDVSTTEASPEATSRTVCEQALKIGMVDTAIQLDHPAFAGSDINEQSFLEQGIDQPHAHGTAVAGLLVGANEQFPPRLPRASLYNASVFYTRNQYAQGATMMHLIKGLDWLMREDVSVVNMSLAGPDNRILAAAIAKVIESGKIIVAAAGNEGPAAPPLYPAAYPNVISATAVDSDQRVYRWANRGDHVDFAALGVSVVTARGDGKFGRESGTSMAAPTVSAFVACELANNSGTADAIIERLANKAVDLGDAGRDPVFGYGLLR